ncbi:MAG: hypothetical protein ACLGHN_03885 [Bacteriovoracia bacterium]
MKLKALFIALVLTVLSAPAFAQWNANAQMFVTPNAAVARVVNVWGRPVHCTGQVFGLTASGIWFQASFGDIVPAGQYREAVVYTNAMINPFVNGKSNIWCNLL